MVSAMDIHDLGDAGDAQRLHLPYAEARNASGGLKRAARTNMPSIHGGVEPHGR